jgi:hypothetical protein
MGGFGSGERSSKKATVEECWSLDASRLSRQGVFASSGFSGRSLTWTNSLGEPTLAVPYWVEIAAGSTPVLHLLLPRVEPDGSGETDELIPLAGTCPHFGGARWWFLCPLVVNGAACERRVRKLYLPPRGRYFGCRTCYDLTYESAQTHDRRVDHLRKNPVALIAALNSKNPRESLLGMGAYVKLCGL